MKQPTVRVHPLAEILAKALFGIESVPKKYQRRMVTKAIKEAVKYHDNTVAELKEIIDEVV